MFAISLRVLEKSGYLESTREMEDAQPSLGTDKVLAGLFQVLFLLFRGELEDSAEGVLDGVREEPPCAHHGWRSRRCECNWSIERSRGSYGAVGSPRDVVVAEGGEEAVGCGCCLL